MQRSSWTSKHTVKALTAETFIVDHITQCGDRSFTMKIKMTATEWVLQNTSVSAKKIFSTICLQSKEPQYTKVRRSGSRLRESDSQDIQFLETEGSTDSEVRKILTLHIPITEYDTTLGSESDNECSAKSMKQTKYKSQRGKTWANSPKQQQHFQFNFY